MNNASMSIETITPATAKDYLNANTNNRRVRKSRVAIYADAMRQGEWLMTGEPIVFSSDGSLINGQHRLAACIEADHPFTTVVVRGVGAEAYTYLDSGLARTVADVVTHDGVKNARMVAAAARIVIAYRAGALHNHAIAARTATRQAIRAELVELDDIYQTGCHHAQQASQRGQVPSAVCAMYTLLITEEAPRDAVDEFMRGATTGASLDEGDARLALSNLFLGHNRPRTGVEALAFYIRAWNAWRKNEPRRHLKGWVQGSAYPVLEI